MQCLYNGVYIFNGTWKRGYNDAMVSIFTMVHGREVIMMQWCLYLQWYNGRKRGYNDATVSIFSMVHGREVIMMQWCLYLQWYMDVRL